MERLRVKEDPLSPGDDVFVLVSRSHHKTSRLWTLAQDIHHLRVGAAQEEEG